MQNIEKQVKALFLLGQENKEKHIKGESNLSGLTKAIDLISGKFDDYERERPEKDKVIKETIYDQIADGIRIKSRCEWYEDGEKSTKLILNPEKKRRVQHRIWKILTKKKK